MNVLSGANLRRLIPVGAVAAVLAISYIAQAPSLASTNDVGYGYANNCGVKGDGTHDHGKACPNRPFPGHGKGVLRILAGTATTPGGSSTTAIGGGDEDSTTGATETSDGSTGTPSHSDLDQGAKSHGKGHDTGHGRSHVDDRQIGR